MKINDCTNCLNKGRCFVKGGIGQYCKGVANGYIRGEWANGFGGGLCEEQGEVANTKEGSAE